jgi:hypothetical protein
MSEQNDSNELDDGRVLERYGDDAVAYSDVHIRDVVCSKCGSETDYNLRSLQISATPAWEDDHAYCVTMSCPCTYAPQLYIRDDRFGVVLVGLSKLTSL